MTVAVGSGDDPQFTLTCISTGGPATTVTWTRDPGTVMGDEMSVFDITTTATTAEYTHTLTVSGRLGGLYTCTVANDKPSEDSAQLNVQGLQSITQYPGVRRLIRLKKESIDVAFVEWQELPNNTDNLCMRSPWRQAVLIPLAVSVLSVLSLVIYCQYVYEYASRPRMVCARMHAHTTSILQVVACSLPVHRQDA